MALREHGAQADGIGFSARRFRLDVEQSAHRFIFAEDA